MIKFKGKNTKFEKRQRLSIYKAALKFFRANNDSWNYDNGLCHIINEVTGETCPDGGCYSEILRFFPEIMKRKPKTANWWWFENDKSGKRKRINLLKQLLKN
jgi:hypothetical protein